MKQQKRRLASYAKRRTRKGFTAMDAINDLGITRVSARIHEMRQEGYVFLDSYEVKGKARWKRWWLIKEPGSAATK